MSTDAPRAPRASLVLLSYLAACSHQPLSPSLQYFFDRHAASTRPCVSCNGAAALSSGATVAVFELPRPWKRHGAALDCCIKALKPSTHFSEVCSQQKWKRGRGESRVQQCMAARARVRALACPILPSAPLRFSSRRLVTHIESPTGLSRGNRTCPGGIVGSRCVHSQQQHKGAKSSLRPWYPPARRDLLQMSRPPATDITFWAYSGS